MAERLHLINAPKAVFDGPPVVFFPGNESLPPPVEKPKRKAKQIPVSPTPLTVPNDVRRMPMADAIKALLALGWRNADIERALKIGLDYISRVKTELKHQQAQTNPSAVFNGSSAEQLYEHHAAAIESRRKSAALARIPVPEVAFAPPLPCASPAPAPSPIPVHSPAPLAPWQASREPIRQCFVIEWAHRMQSWNFTQAPDGVIPPKPKRYAKRLTHVQAKEEWNMQKAGRGSINPKPAPEQRQRAAVDCGKVDPFAG